MRVGGRLGGEGEVAGCVAGRGEAKMPVYRRTQTWWQSNGPRRERLWCADEWINRGREGDKAALRTR
jgi:hypothetical protein